MAAPSESGSIVGFFLLKGNFRLHCRLMQAQDRGLNQREDSCYPLVSLASQFFINWHYINWTDLDWYGFYFIRLKNNCTKLDYKSIKVNCIFKVPSDYF